MATSHSIYIGVKERIAAKFEWGFSKIEHKLYFKSSATEKP